MVTPDGLHAGCCLNHGAGAGRDPRMRRENEPPLSAGRLILVEGTSDRIALETLARRRGLDRPAIVVLGGAHAVGNHARRAPRGVELVGLCDAREERVFRRAVARVHVCNPDLEGELIRALGPERVLRLIDAEGERASFRTLQRQPAQRRRPLEAQLLRFLAGRAGNKERYARLLVEALDLDRAPAALDAALGRR
jgi:hypothetical protein